MNIALTREVSPRIGECELTHLSRAPIDVARARTQHATYEDALRALGCEVRRIAAAPDQPDGVFVEDTAVVLDELAVICRPGATSRQEETEAVSATLGTLRPLASITSPGTVDGGDVIRSNRRLFVGRSARTNSAGVAQLEALTRSRGYDVIPVEFRGCLHLKTAATLVAPGLALINPNWVVPAALAPLDYLTVDPTEPMAANALLLGDEVLYPAEFPRTRARLVAAGVRVRAVPASELAKAEGGVTCCSIIVEKHSNRGSAFAGNQRQ